MIPKQYGGAKGRHKPGTMNALEKWYAAHLESLKVSGDILGYWFEAVKLRLADKTFYTPDFMVMMKNFEIEFHEPKGFMLDDANVKIKVAAEMYPFKFRVIRKIKGVLHISNVGNKE